MWLPVLHVAWSDLVMCSHRKEYIIHDTESPHCDQASLTIYLNSTQQIVGINRASTPSPPHTLSFQYYRIVAHFGAWAYKWTCAPNYIGTQDVYCNIYHTGAPTIFVSEGHFWDLGTCAKKHNHTVYQLNNKKDCFSRTSSLVVISMLVVTMFVLETGTVSGFVSKAGSCGWSEMMLTPLSLLHNAPMTGTIIIFVFDLIWKLFSS